MEEQNLCKKCFCKKHKLSKKTIDRIVFSSWREECDNCGHIDKIVIDFMEEEEW